MSINELILIVLLVGTANSKPSVNVFMVTYNAEPQGRVVSLAWQGPFADVGFDQLKQAFGERFNFSFEYIMPGSATLQVGLLGNDIEDLIARHYWTRFDSADALAHLYSGTT